MDGMFELGVAAARLGAGAHRNKLANMQLAMQQQQAVGGAQQQMQGVLGSRLEDQYTGMLPLASKPTIQAPRPKLPTKANMGSGPLTNMPAMHSPKPSLAKAAEESEHDGKEVPPKAKDIVNMDSARGRAADYLYPMTWGGERAGRSQALANASGVKTPFGVKHPTSSALLASLVGSLAGGGLGFGGMLLNEYTGKKMFDQHDQSYLPLIGSGLGSIGGYLYDRANARSGMKAINENYDQTAEAGGLTPEKPELSSAEALLAPLRGPHRVGQVEGHRAISGEKAMNKQRGDMPQARDVMYAINRFGGIPGMAATGWGQNLLTQRASPAPFKLEPKQASTALSLALNQGREKKKLTKAALFGSSIDPEEKKKKQQKATLPWTGIALGGGAAASMGLANALASEEQANRANEAITNYNPRAFTHNELPPNQTGLTYYQNTLSPSSQLTPFGVPVGKALVAVRSDPDIMEAIGTESYGLYSPQEQHGLSGLAHYNMFSKGPIPAYQHQMKAKFPHTPVPTELNVPEGTKYTEWMGRKMEDFMQQETGQRINPFEVNTQFMPHEEQKALMERFHASLSPEEQAFRMKIEDPDPTFQARMSKYKADIAAGIKEDANGNPLVEPRHGYEAQTSNYLPKAKSLLDVRNLLKDIAVTGGGAAAGAVGGHMLYDVLRDKKDKEKSHWGRTAASVGGAGLGGGAAYFLGTAKGQTMLANAIRGLKRQALGLPKTAAVDESLQTQGMQDLLVALDLKKK